MGGKNPVGRLVGAKNRLTSESTAMFYAKELRRIYGSTVRQERMFIIPLEFKRVALSV